MREFMCLPLFSRFVEVRCATLSTITQIASHNARFASLCQDILVDMLTDDIQAVRLRAITALQTVGDQVVNFFFWLPYFYSQSNYFFVPLDFNGIFQSYLILPQVGLR